MSKFDTYNNENLKPEERDAVAILAAHHLAVTPGTRWLSFIYVCNVIAERPELVQMAVLAVHEGRTAEMMQQFEHAYQQAITHQDPVKTMAEEWASESARNYFRNNAPEIIKFHATRHADALARQRAARAKNTGSAAER